MRQVGYNHRNNINNSRNYESHHSQLAKAAVSGGIQPDPNYYVVYKNGNLLIPAEKRVDGLSLETVRRCCSETYDLPYVPSDARKTGDHHLKWLNGQYTRTRIFSSDIARSARQMFSFNVNCPRDQSSRDHARKDQRVCKCAYHRFSRLVYGDRPMDIIGIDENFVYVVQRPLEGSHSMHSNTITPTPFTVEGDSSSFDGSSQRQGALQGVLSSPKTPSTSAKPSGTKILKSSVRSGAGESSPPPVVPNPTLHNNAYQLVGYDRKYQGRVRVVAEEQLKRGRDGSMQIEVEIPGGVPPANHAPRAFCLCDVCIFERPGVDSLFPDDGLVLTGMTQTTVAVITVTRTEHDPATNSMKEVMVKQRMEVPVYGPEVVVPSFIKYKLSRLLFGWVRQQIPALSYDSSKRGFFVHKGNRLLDDNGYSDASPAFRDAARTFVFEIEEIKMIVQAYGQYSSPYPPTTPHVDPTVVGYDFSWLSEPLFTVIESLRGTNVQSRRLCDKICSHLLPNTPLSDVESFRSSSEIKSLISQFGTRFYDGLAKIVRTSKKDFLSKSAPNKVVIVRSDLLLMKVSKVGSDGVFYNLTAEPLAYVASDYSKNPFNLRGDPNGCAKPQPSHQTYCFCTDCEVGRLGHPNEAVLLAATYILRKIAAGVETLLDPISSSSQADKNSSSRINGGGRRPSPDDLPVREGTQGGAVVHQQSPPPAPVAFSDMNTLKQVIDATPDVYTLVWTVLKGYDQRPFKHFFERLCRSILSRPPNTMNKDLVNIDHDSRPDEMALRRYTSNTVDHHLKQCQNQTMDMLQNAQSFQNSNNNANTTPATAAMSSQQAVGSSNRPKNTTAALPSHSPLVPIMHDSPRMRTNQTGTGTRTDTTSNFEHWWEGVGESSVQQTSSARSFGDNGAPYSSMTNDSGIPYSASQYVSEHFFGNMDPQEVLNMFNIDTSGFPMHSTTGALNQNSSPGQQYNNNISGLFYHLLGQSNQKERSNKTNRENEWHTNNNMNNVVENTVKYGSSNKIVSTSDHATQWNTARGSQAQPPPTIAKRPEMIHAPQYPAPASSMTGPHPNHYPSSSSSSLVFVYSDHNSNAADENKQVIRRWMLRETMSPSAVPFVYDNGMPINMPYEGIASSHCECLKCYLRPIASTLPPSMGCIVEYLLGNWLLGYHPSRAPFVGLADLQSVMDDRLLLRDLVDTLVQITEMYYQQYFSAAVLHTQAETYKVAALPEKDDSDDSSFELDGESLSLIRGSVSYTAQSRLTEALWRRWEDCGAVDPVRSSPDWSSMIRKHLVPHQDAAGGAKSSPATEEALSVTTTSNTQMASLLRRVMMRYKVRSTLTELKMYAETYVNSSNNPHMSSNHHYDGPFIGIRYIPCMMCPTPVVNVCVSRCTKCLINVMGTPLPNEEESEVPLKYQSPSLQRVLECILGLHYGSNRVSDYPAILEQDFESVIGGNSVWDLSGSESDAKTNNNSNNTNIISNKVVTGNVECEEDGSHKDTKAMLKTLRTNENSYLNCDSYASSDAEGAEDVRQLPNTHSATNSHHEGKGCVNPLDVNPLDEEQVYNVDIAGARRNGIAMVDNTLPSSFTSLRKGTIFYTMRIGIERLDRHPYTRDIAHYLWKRANASPVFSNRKKDSRLVALIQNVGECLVNRSGVTAHQMPLSRCGFQVI